MGFFTPCMSCCLNDAPSDYSSIYNPDLGCEGWGAVAYPVCAPAYSNSACCLCSFNGGCPGPYFNGAGPNGCLKSFYNRIPHCPVGLVLGTDGFCYPKCIDGYDGGKVCY